MCSSNSNSLATNEALDIEDCAFWVEGSLKLGCVANQALCVCKSHI